MHCCASHLCSQEGDEKSRTQLGSSPTHARSEQTEPQNSRYTPRCHSVVLWTPLAASSGARSNRPSRGSGTTGKQPANLGLEGAEESLSILPDYTPTVRPPPKRC
jgi:hypothetical protein